MGSSGQGVHGESFASGGSNGYGPDGVDGITHSANGSGVAGVNDAPGGTGVYGVSTNGGFGFQTPSNVQQARGMGGWLKAMAYVDPFTTGGISIVRCYNSQASGATVWTPPCGISIVNHQQGFNVLDFGFQVNDRFINASSQSCCVVVTAGTIGESNANRVDVQTTLSGDYSSVDSQFTIFIY
jgi:hypothetical protein